MPGRSTEPSYAGIMAEVAEVVEQVIVGNVVMGAVLYCTNVYAMCFELGFCISTSNHVIGTAVLMGERDAVVVEDIINVEVVLETAMVLAVQLETDMPS